MKLRRGTDRNLKSRPFTFIFPNERTERPDKTSGSFSQAPFCDKNLIQKSLRSLFSSYYLFSSLPEGLLPHPPSEIFLCSMSPHLFVLHNLTYPSHRTDSSVQTQLLVTLSHPARVKLHDYPSVLTFLSYKCVQKRKREKQTIYCF